MTTKVSMVFWISVSLNVGGYHQVIASEYDDTYDYNEYENDTEDTVCEPGLLLPAWKQHGVMSSGDRLARGLVYLLAILYLFVGVFVISKKFVRSIEVITSKVKNKNVSTDDRPNGDTESAPDIEWNETVANLTLRAMGLSAPGIFLSIIDIFGNRFESGDLGAGTITGSAAFNLFIILSIAVCMIPINEVKKIQRLPVFIVTSSSSLFAYLWLVFILKVVSPGIVDLWEGIVTILFFPVIVYAAYLANKWCSRGGLRSNMRHSSEESSSSLRTPRNHTDDVTEVTQFNQFDTQDENIETGKLEGIRQKNCWDHLSYCLTFPWRIIFAWVPRSGNS